MAGERRKNTLLQSFNNAFQGIVYAVRHQRNMRVHLAVGVVVLIVSLLLDLSKLELAAVLMAIAFVLGAELINSAVEQVVDLLTDEFDPRAKAAKDLAA
ncbi:MAG: diacylglycerol kinase family protein, partial [Actinobacteria bacterium]|nr:diacylglycerol kinase family protein [Actinomycetota bacterium]